MVERVRVTSSRRHAVPRSTRPLRDEIGQQTDLGRLYLRGLIRAQLRLTATLLVLGTLLVAGAQIALVALPGLTSRHLAGIGLAWWVFGVAAYPAIVLLAVVYVRSAERLERGFHDLTAGSAPDGGSTRP